MECSNLIATALKQGDVSAFLFKGSADLALIEDLQKVLFELGFKKELKLDKYEVDGDFGPATADAVAAFATKNKLTDDGTSVSNSLAKLMLQRHSFLPEMYLLWSIYNSDLRAKKYISRGTRMSVTAIQLMLFERGYAEQLNFQKFGADGMYGDSTRKAMKAYARDNQIDSDGDLLTRPLMDLMLRDINAFYGKNWSDLAVNNLPSANSPLVLFEASRFQGKPCRADVLFVPTLEMINQHAERANVFVHVTSSFRTSANVAGAIVKPATRSNHMAGHAIDMNVVYDNKKQLADSKVLAKYPQVPEPVRLFIKSIIDDPNLRWGGNFQAKDPVHIDDNLNQDLARWDQRYQAMQKAVQLGG
ncbi:peptidoglycan-binding protein [Dyadobacter fanqingshengii]|uniref:M15 family metallopeptidase n=1 Tax=Dyadobacter fanqingshengii TaxID=2906443 RepID=A0A9X1T844_9BACT|nr:peptidoglycan-binding protein [Dyadobacter fanqingshengii]MCF0039785.1 M15 family metallopeptidase [Dyadobacter fanqingshengii]USJ38452.1 M15 family metallopeptidase [Dyadobacter fanqingshengii]